MGEQRKSATFFTFSGGLNTNASLLNTPPTDSTEISNVVLDSDGSVRRRRGVQPLAARLDGEYFIRTGIDISSSDGSWSFPVSSSYIFKITLQDGSRQQVVAISTGDEIRINMFADTQSIGQFDDEISAFVIKLQDVPEQAKYNKSKMINNGNYLYIINPYIPLTEIFYDEIANTWEAETVSILVRNLSDNPPVDSYVNRGGKNWKCIQTHDPSTLNAPGSEGDGWKDFWELVGSTNDSYSDWSVNPNYSQVKLVTTEVVEEDYGEGTQLRERKTYTLYEAIITHIADSGNRPPNASYWRKVETKVSYYDRERFPGVPTWEAGTQYFGAGATYTSNVERVSWSGSDQYPGFKAGCFSVGRTWLANHPGKRNTVYFSRVAQKQEQYQYMFQFADPYNRLDPDLVDTDGGTIEITGAGEIIQLTPFRGGVLAFADNGVWYIAGQPGSSFTATNYSIEKISDEGLVGSAAVVDIEEAVVYGSHTDIYVVALGQVSGIPEVSVISSKISDIWRQSGANNRASSDFQYEAATRKLYVYTNLDITPEVQTNIYPTGAGVYTTILVFDIQLQAWYRFDIDPGDTTENPIYQYPQIVGSIPQFVTESVPDNIVVGADNVVATIGGFTRDVVTYSRQDARTLDTHFVMIGMRNYSLASGSPVFTDNFEFCLGLLEGTTFRDFEIDSSVRLDNSRSYSSIVESAPQVFNDIAHKKQAPYFYTAFRVVETGIDEETDLYLNPGSCMYRLIWDWSTSSDAAKWGNAYQAYTPHLLNRAYLDGRFSGYEVVRSKHRLRGRGEVFQLRFESEEDKDFHLLGFQVDLYVTPKV